MTVEQILILSLGAFYCVLRIIVDFVFSLKNGKQMKSLNLKLSDIFSYPEMKDAIDDKNNNGEAEKDSSLNWYIEENNRLRSENDYLTALIYQQKKDSDVVDSNKSVEEVFENYNNSLLLKEISELTKKMLGEKNG